METVTIMKTCQRVVDIDDCANSPCQNNGTCTDNVNGHTCTCVDGYSGENCETGTYACACYDVSLGYSKYPYTNSILRRNIFVCIRLIK